MSHSLQNSAHIYMDRIILVEFVYKITRRVLFVMMTLQPSVFSFACISNLNLKFQFCILLFKFIFFVLKTKRLIKEKPDLVIMAMDTADAPQMIEHIHKVRSCYLHKKKAFVGSYFSSMFGNLMTILVCWIYST